jgi:hypothetical protein
MSVRCVDHLTDVMNKFYENDSSSCSKTLSADLLRLHRSKCTALLKNAIAPTLHKEVMEDIGNAKFSLITDESTDKSTQKYLTINVKYYSQNHNKIMTQFLSFLYVEAATADSLYDVVYNYFQDSDLKMHNILSIGTDGANNMCGNFNSLYSRIRDNQNSNIILVKCVCHSLHLCASKAREVFENSIDFLLRETYSWFKHSPLKTAQYKHLYELINLNEGNSKYTKLIQLSGTCWLSRYKAVEKILSQYLELKALFNIESKHR